ncbi:GDP-mannose 4,6-dehydratase [Candidatus Pelagibacter bacterium]|mgnify:CR=1 FL=1|nr:GDP-mannose 4,6-dehydratase [Candidatus Pelagibacter bacterium]|tara:strand:+ start:191 stop:1198 length:1008 start_codon:yes stop_codon:yes gene_type:complete
MSILITGVGGFIGFHTASKLIDKNKKVFGIDNLNNYYDVKLKKKRIQILHQKKKNFIFFKDDINNKKFITKIFKKYKFKKVIHLAAQAGVRYSITNPEVYIKNNINGFFNILDLCKEYKVKHLVYASTSSVYGANTNLPYKENYSTDHPIQLYAATKKSNELMAHSYSSLFNLPTTGLRFFTVYGPWGRPDMALFKFTKNIINNKKIDVFNYGNHLRDFTYIDDIVSGIISAVNNTPKRNKSWNSKYPQSSSSNCPFRIFNIGNNKPISLMKYILEIERYLGKKAKKNFLKLQKGDIKATFSNTDKICKEIKFRSKTDVKKGIKNFIDWYKDYYK